MSEPRIIQGGMGIGVSGWQLARAVSKLGHLGVVSGTAVDTVMVRRLQDGDDGGHVQRAVREFPAVDVGEQVLTRFYRPSGRQGAPYRNLPMFRRTVTVGRAQLTMLANFVEVWLAKEGHGGPVGINFLEKVQLATPAAAYGAMLAGVDYVLMGAGIPRELPRLLDRLARHEVGRLSIDVQGADQVRPKWPGHLAIFLRLPTLADYERRLRARGTEDEASLAKRLANARGELARAGEYHYQVHNDDLEAAVAQLRALVASAFLEGGNAR